MIKILLALLAACFVAFDDDLAFGQGAPPGRRDGDDPSFTPFVVDDDLVFGRDGFPGRRVGGGSRFTAQAAAWGIHQRSRWRSRGASITTQ